MMNLKKTFKAAIESCGAERQAFNAARNTLAATRKALSDSRSRVDALSRAIDKARPDLSEAVVRGVDIAEHISTRAKAMAEITIMNELASDLEFNEIPKAEREIKKAETVLDAKLSAKFSEAVCEAQTELDELFIQVARRIDEFGKEFKNTCKEYPEAASTSYIPSLKWRDTCPALTEEGHMSGNWR